MDVGESPVNETNEFCAALLVRGTMALCPKPKTTTRLMEGGNRGTGFSVPLCEEHGLMFDTAPDSFEVAIQGVPLK